MPVLYSAATSLLMLKAKFHYTSRFGSGSEPVILPAAFLFSVAWKIQTIGQPNIIIMDLNAVSKRTNREERLFFMQSVLMLKLNEPE